MPRPRIRPIKFYRALDSGFYVDQETGDELTFLKGRTYPDILIEKEPPHISMSRQEKMCKVLASAGTFTLADPIDAAQEIERVSTEPTEIK